MTLQISLAARRCWAIPTMELVMFEFCKEGKRVLAEGRFLSGCIQVMQLHFLVGEVSGRDPGCCTRRECHRWNLVLIKSGIYFGARAGLSRTVICSTVILLWGKDVVNSKEFCCLVSEI